MLHFRNVRHGLHICKKPGHNFFIAARRPNQKAVHKQRAGTV